MRRRDLLVGAAILPFAACALATAAEMKARGADIEAIEVGPLGHDPSALAAAPQALAWLESL